MENIFVNETKFKLDDDISAPPAFQTVSMPGHGWTSTAHYRRESKIQTRMCTNCNTTNTPLWHQSPEGDLLCNSCGLFLKLHGVVRPLSVTREVIKKRKHGGGNSGMTTFATSGVTSWSERKYGMESKRRATEARADSSTMALGYSIKNTVVIDNESDRSAIASLVNPTTSQPDRTSISDTEIKAPSDRKFTAESLHRKTSGDGLGVETNTSTAEWGWWNMSNVSSFG